MRAIAVGAAFQVLRHVDCTLAELRRWHHLVDQPECQGFVGQHWRVEAHELKGTPCADSTRERSGGAGIRARSPTPPPATFPATAAMTGFGSTRISRSIGWKASISLAAARGAVYDAADIGIVANLRERGPDRRDHLVIDGIQAIGPIEADHCDCAMRFQQDRR